MVEVGAVTPEVKGAVETDEAPAKATAVVVAVGFAVAVVLEGLRTLWGKVLAIKWVDLVSTVLAGGVWKLSRGGEETYASTTCITPFATSTFGVTTLALLTKMVPLEMVMVRVSPFMAVSLVPFIRFVLYPMAPALPVLFTTGEVVSPCCYVTQPE